MFELSVQNEGTYRTNKQTYSTSQSKWKAYEKRILKISKEIHFDQFFCCSFANLTVLIVINLLAEMGIWGACFTIFPISLVFQLFWSLYCFIFINDSNFLIANSSYSLPIPWFLGVMLTAWCCVFDTFSSRIKRSSEQKFLILHLHWFWSMHPSASSASILICLYLQADSCIWKEIFLHVIPVSIIVSCWN